MGSNPVGVTTSWGYSSAGRARALQARGHRFEPCCPHHIKKRATLCVVLFLCVGKQHRARIRRVIRLCANHCAPVPRSHCTLASKCKHFRFAVDKPCCPTSSTALLTKHFMIKAKSIASRLLIHLPASTKVSCGIFLQAFASNRRPPTVRLGSRP